MTDMTDMVARLEAASEGSRKLDCAVWLLASDPVDLPNIGYGQRGHASDCATHNEPANVNGPCDCGASKWNDRAPWVRGFLNSGCDAEVFAYEEKTVPRYTTSLDAALLLVPPQHWWTAGDCKREKHAHVAPEHIDHDGWEGFGATVALALCIAALKARSAA